jgi:hypothetical protein
MTSITTANSQAEDTPWPAPDTIILRNRALHPLSDTTDLSRFDDDVWFTTPADVDNPKAAPSLNFTRHPEPLRTSFKTFTLAALDHERPRRCCGGRPGRKQAWGPYTGGSWSSGRSLNGSTPAR